MFFAPLKSRLRVKIWIMGVTKTSDLIWIKIKMPNPSQKPPAYSKAQNQELKDMVRYFEHRWIKDQCIKNHSQELPASAKAPNEDFKDMDVLCTLRIKIESQNLIYGWCNNSDHIQINIRMQNPSQEPSAFSKAPNQDLKDIDVICTFKTKIESHVCITD